MEDLPRWRVLCPTSCALPASDRAELVGRLNAVLGGVLSRESHTLSQPFYIGHTGAQWGHAARLVEVAPIDLCAGFPEPIYPERAVGVEGTLPPMVPGTAPDLRAGQAMAAAVAMFGEPDIEARGRHHVIVGATLTVAPFVKAGLLDQTEAVEDIEAACSASGRDPNPGEVANALAGAVRFARPFEPPTFGAEFDALPPLPGAAPARRRLFVSRDFQMGGRESYVIKHLLAPGQVGALLGQPGAGKSTLGPHLAYAVAQGRPVFGLRTAQGRALYVAAEDIRGVQKRVGALGAKYGHTDDCAVVESGNLREPEDRAALMETVMEFRPTVIFVDTVAAAWAGIEENSSQDMGGVVQFARQLAATGAAVVLIHHPSKQGGDGSARGHGVLQGTLDMVITLAPDDLADADTVVRGSFPKNRSGTTARQIAFRKQVIHLGVDHEGDAITTTLPAEVGADAPAPAKLTEPQAAFLAMIREAPAGVAESKWVAFGQTLSTATKSTDQVRAARNMHSRLVRKGLIRVGNGMSFAVLSAVGSDRGRITGGSVQTTDFVEFGSLGSSLDRNE